MPPARACCYCHRGPRQGVELRPYGPQGAPVCSPCARATPERRETAQAQMRARFAALGDGPVILTADGPRRAVDVVATFACARCGDPPTPAEREQIVALLERSSAMAAHPPPVQGFVCDACTATVPVVCAACSQPIVDGVGRVGDDGRPRHEDGCPDWLVGMLRERDERRAVDEADRVAAVADALDRLSAGEIEPQGGAVVVPSYDAGELARRALGGRRATD